MAVEQVIDRGSDIRRQDRPIVGREPSWVNNGLSHIPSPWHSALRTGFQASDQTWQR
jgi:hypothetical protein